MNIHKKLTAYDISIPAISYMFDDDDHDTTITRLKTDPPVNTFEQTLADLFPVSIHAANAILIKALADKPSRNQPLDVSDRQIETAKFILSTALGLAKIKKA